jgi:uncharacterized protein (DUF1015 family)
VAALRGLSFSLVNFVFQGGSAVMAQVLPFVGIRYNIEKVGGLSKCATPPYDVITPEMQDAYYQAHEQNIVRVDFGRELATDDESDNKYVRASALLAQWKQDRVLAQDDHPTYTAYEQEFTLPDGSAGKRRGILAAVKIEDPDGGGIYAHEKTFDGPKSDRFRLLCATQCNTSPVFCVYKDARHTVDQILEKECARDPWTEYQDESGVKHRVWIIGAEKTCQAITKSFENTDLFIADGHHRYETALSYRNRMRSQLKRSDGMQPFDFTLMYLANAEDGGVTILPIHRVLAPEMDDGVDPDEFYEDLREFFLVKRIRLDLKKPGAADRMMARVNEAGEERPSIGCILPGGRAAVLSLRKGRKRGDMIMRKIPLAIRKLDVTLLHEIILRQTWVGNPEVDFDDHDIYYRHQPSDALDLLMRRKGCAVFLMNPPRLDQMVEVAQAGCRMPHKSTFFYPKVATGIVMRELSLS